MDSEGQMETNVPVKGVAKGKRIKENWQRKRSIADTIP